MSIHHEKIEKKETPAAKDKYIRSMISYMASDKVNYYSRGDHICIDTTAFNGNRLLSLDGAEFTSFMLRTGKATQNLLLRSADIKLIVEHVILTAREKAEPLSVDPRSTFSDGKIIINTGSKEKKMIVIDTEIGTWKETVIQVPVFEPIPAEMSLVQPVASEPTQFPIHLKEGLADFGEKHCLIAATCATMMLPATFVHPFLVFTGDQARGKSTTMKLLLQLIDPYAGGELMSVGEDPRDLIALCRDRHCIALDNVSKLPFDEDLLSKMYSGGIFAARKMTTNSELSNAHMPRLRVLMNGIGTFFSRSDLIGRCIFVEHPILTHKDAQGYDLFQSTQGIEDRWKSRLPEALGSLLSVIANGWKLYTEEGGHDGKFSRCRYVEYSIIGECMAQAMGFPKGLFTEQANKSLDDSHERSIEVDDHAQLVLAWLNGETVAPQLADF